MPQLGLTPVEEAFFRAGDALSEAASHDAAEPADEPPPTFWHAVVGWLRHARTPALLR